MVLVLYSIHLHFVINLNLTYIMTLNIFLYRLCYQKCSFMLKWHYLNKINAHEQNIQPVHKLWIIWWQEWHFDRMSFISASRLSVWTIEVIVLYCFMTEKSKSFMTLGYSLGIFISHIESIIDNAKSQAKCNIYFFTYNQ